MTKIAEELGISDSALSKKCREHDVPAPYRGYWRQVERGKQVQRVPLPNPEMGSMEVPVNVSEARSRAGSIAGAGGE
ncbi:RWP-RK domain-containing protein [Polaromonas sp. P1(28)-8]|nr:RWP-RK domain-containing protein [Polaromonas sp. P1(28)-8]